MSKHKIFRIKDLINTAPSLTSKERDVMTLIAELHGVRKCTLEELGVPWAAVRSLHRRSFLQVYQTLIAGGDSERTYKINVNALEGFSAHKSANQPSQNEGINMDTHALVNNLYNDLKAVQVQFDQPHGKHFTFKTMIDFEIGDKCVVESAHQGFVVVEVVGTDSTLLEGNYRYKWVVQKVDDTAYQAHVEKEELAIAEVSKLIRERKRVEAVDKLKDLVGDGDSLTAISSDLNSTLES